MLRKRQLHVSIYLVHDFYESVLGRAFWDEKHAFLSLLKIMDRYELETFYYNKWQLGLDNLCKFRRSSIKIVSM